MNAVIDLDTELLIDRSMLNDPVLRIVASALGKPFIKGSCWVVVNKQDLGYARPGNTDRAGSTDDIANSK